jgi:small conductance mechanosensitive channel
MMEAIRKTCKSRKVLLGVLGLFVLGLGGLWLVDPDAFPGKGSFTSAETPSPVPPAAEARTPLTEAERIARLERSVESQRKYLDSLYVQLQDPNSEFNQAEKRFQNVDAEREAVRREVRDLRAAGKLAETAARESALKEIDPRWQQERERFNLAIKEHKALQESIAAATLKLREDQQVLARLSGASKTAQATRDADKTPLVSGGESAKAAQPSNPLPSLLTVPESPLALVSSPTPPAAAASGPAENVSPDVQRAQAEAKLKEEAAKSAERKAQSLTERLDALQENITLTKKLLDAARLRADHEQQTKAELESELQKKAAAHAPDSELKDLTQRMDFAQKRCQQALGEVRTTSDHLHDLQNELSRLQAAQLKALHEADAKKQDAETAEERIAQLQNPFRPRNIVHWLLTHGPRLVLIFLGMLLFHRLARVVSRRVVQIVAQGGSKRGTHQDRENRAQTLVGVFSSALSLLILGGGSLMILDEVGIPIVPLMGGAAVLGLAVAFGAQNLIKDYFSGFMVLLEDQYGINDVVRIGPISGMVEHISLRTTVLRDLEGIVHFIPHGTISTVSNLTHGWSRALFDVDIAYSEDIDRVMEVLLDLGRELRRDPMFGPLILDDPEMLGVDELADSSVIVKFFLKTRPLQQWTVKREMLRRIKNRFDQLGIEIPYPHQTVHHRYETPPPAETPQTPPVKRSA